MTTVGIKQYKPEKNLGVKIYKPMQSLGMKSHITNHPSNNPLSHSRAAAAVNGCDG